MLVLIGGAAVLIARSSADGSKTDARLRAAHGVDLLVTIGKDLPTLTQSAMKKGWSRAAVQRLNAAISHSQLDGLVAKVVIWDRDGRVVYTSRAMAEGTPPPAEPDEPELFAALAGHSSTRVDIGDRDATTGKATGLLDAVQPLIDQDGEVYGAMEVDLPLKPIEDAAARSHGDSLRLVIGGSLLTWLLLMPLWVRLARSQAKDWIPGRRSTLRAFAHALDRGNIELVYQPQIQPGSRRIDSVEALVRWRRDGGLIAPDEFLSSVESSALMPRLTDRVLDLALAQLAHWRAAGIDIRVSVNLSSTDLLDDTLPERIAAKLERYGAEGRDLTVEVTETAILEDTEHTRGVLVALHEMAIDIAVDDFGTGHASIARLRSLPVTEMKIDRSFLADTDQRSRGYLSAIIGFGRSLGLRVVAEGVEDRETLAILTALGCDLAQGYVISRPLPPEAMTVLLTSAAAAPMPRRHQFVGSS
jgi:EAL domain-containing protein (putative c-di-GMP-specific phosphodiesterase class I)